MFSIGEFAHLGGVSIRTLRHYDEIGLLRPARVDPYNGYRTYSAAQLGQLNRIVALKELGLPLAQVKRLMGGITLEELQGMLTLRRAQLEQELDERKDKLLGVEARLRYIATEGAMPADDIVAKKIAAQGAVVMSAPAPGWGAPNIVPVVNGLVEKFDQLGIRDQVTESGPRIIFYEYGDDNDVTVFLALPVAERPQSLPEPPGIWSCPRSRWPQRSATAGRPASSRWCIRILSAGRRSTATGIRCPAARSGSTRWTTSRRSTSRSSRSSCPSPAPRPRPGSAGSQTRPGSSAALLAARSTRSR